MVFSSIHAHADEVDDAKTSITQLEQQDKTDEITQKTADGIALKNELSKINDEISNIQIKLDQTNQSISDKEKEIDATSKSLTTNTQLSMNRKLRKFNLQKPI